ncbi:isochorismate synthase [Thermonema lapsum]|uniref:Isochorismate synthase n=1 Tax=Thermonema lapsum TaxID=28195 RepID=A0A846MP51_9BACT|nr:chorismate-binding protein [Thermonema lapsum]NIK73336.1 isochorismate synthase [Thermonema lapsum]
MNFSSVHTLGRVAWLEAAFYAAYRMQLPVVLWRLPHRNEQYCLVDMSGGKRSVPPSVLDPQPSFLVSPFVNAPDLSDTICLRPTCLFSTRTPVQDIEAQLAALPGDFRALFYEYLHGKEPLPAGCLPSWQEDTPQEQNRFEALVQRAVNEIAAGKLQKVVLSRRKSLPVESMPPLSRWFASLAACYPHAMVTLLYLPAYGCWLGATPEVLAAQDAQGIFHTMALAGTQAYDPAVPLQEVAWRQKEIEEQALVSRYIINCFKTLRLREFEEYGPRTVRAANLIHLRTDFKVDTRSLAYPQLLDRMLPLLHPTSAVCGMPKDAAMDFLHRHENYDRQLYSGFLGPLGVEGESAFFVNLRCLQYTSGCLHFYAGCGITADSDPRKEWNETCYKMQTLWQGIQS